MSEPPAVAGGLNRLRNAEFEMRKSKGPPATAGGSDSMKPHGYIGLLIVVVAEVLLFSGNQLIGVWFTPIVWTGYILFIDAVVYKVTRHSLLVTDRLELLVIAVISIAAWWLFEFYNAPRFWQSDLELWWHYHNLTPNPFLRRFGYDWAFATIFPALFETAALFQATLFARRGPTFSLRLSKATMYLLILLGAIAVILPLVVLSNWLAPVVWLSFILLLDPINRLRDQPSIIGDLAQGRWNRLLSLLASGGLCGLLWEFWNYWALSRWTYTVPFFGDVKIFEMPVLGFLGFPPFAVECWVMYVFVRSLLVRARPGTIAEMGMWIRNH